MKVISRESKAAELLDGLRKRPEGWVPYQCNNVENWREKALAKLEALGPNPDPDRIEEFWPLACSGIMCNECKRDVSAVVEIGDEPDYESSTAWVCAACLLGALALIEP